MCNKTYIEYNNRPVQVRPLPRCTRGASAHRGQLVPRGTEADELLTLDADHLSHPQGAYPGEPRSPEPQLVKLQWKIEINQEIN